MQITNTKIMKNEILSYSETKRLKNLQYVQPKIKTRCVTENVHQALELNFLGVI